MEKGRKLSAVFGGNSQSVGGRFALRKHLLAERALLAADGGYPAWPYEGVPNQHPMNPTGSTGVPPYQGQGTAIVPSPTSDFGKNPDGGQS